MVGSEIKLASEIGRGLFDFYKYLSMAKIYAHSRAEIEGMGYINEAYQKSGLAELGINAPFVLEGGGALNSLMTSPVGQAIAKDKTEPAANVSTVSWIVPDYDKQLKTLKTSDAPYPRYHELLHAIGQSLLDYVKDRTAYTTGLDHGLSSATDGRSVFSGKKGEKNDAISLSIFYALNLILVNMGNPESASPEQLMKLTEAIQNYLKEIARMPNADQRVRLYNQVTPLLNLATEEIKIIAASGSATTGAARIETRAHQAVVGGYAFLLLATGLEANFNKHRTKIRESNKNVAAHQVEPINGDRSVLKTTSIGTKAEHALAGMRGRSINGQKLGNAFPEDEVNIIVKQLDGSPYFKRAYCRGRENNDTFKGNPCDKHDVSDLYMRETTPEERKKFAEGLCAIDELVAVMAYTETLTEHAKIFMAYLGDGQAFSAKQIEPFYNALALLKAEIDRLEKIADPVFEHLKNYGEIFVNTKSHILIYQAKCFKENINRVTESISDLQNKKVDLKNIHRKGKEAGERLNQTISTIVSAYANSTTVSQATLTQLQTSIVEKDDDIKIAKALLTEYYEGEENVLTVIIDELEQQIGAATTAPALLHDLRQGLAYAKVVKEALGQHKLGVNDLGTLQGIQDHLRSSQGSQLLTSEQWNTLGQPVKNYLDKGFGNRLQHDSVRKLAAFFTNSTPRHAYASVYSDIKNLQSESNEARDRVRGKVEFRKPLVEGAPEVSFLAKVKKQNGKLCELIEEKEEKLKGAAETVEQCNNKIAELDKNVEILNQQKTTLQEQLDRFTAMVESTTKSMSEELSTLVSRIESSRKAIEEMPEATSDLESLKTITVNKRTALDTLEKAIDSAEKLQKWVNGLVDEAGEHAGQMQYTLDKMGETISTAKANAAGLKSQLAFLKESLDKIIKINHETENKLAETEAELKCLQKQQSDTARCKSFHGLVEQVKTVASKEKQNQIKRWQIGDKANGIYTKHDHDEFLAIVLGHYDSHVGQATRSGRKYLELISRIQSNIITLAGNDQVAKKDLCFGQDKTPSLRGCRKYVLEQLSGKNIASNSEMEKKFAYKKSDPKTVAQQLIDIHVGEKEEYQRQKELKRQQEEEKVQAAVEERRRALLEGVKEQLQTVQPATPQSESSTNEKREPATLLTPSAVAPPQVIIPDSEKTTNSDAYISS